MTAVARPRSGVGIRSPPAGAKVGASRRNRSIPTGVDLERTVPDTSPVGQRVGNEVALERTAQTAKPGKMHEDLRIPTRPLLTLEPRAPATGLVVIFHGAGDTANGFRDLANYWGAGLSHVKFVLPTAPVRGRMTAWFGKNSKTGKLQNYEALWCEVLCLVEAERLHNQIPLSRVVFLGLSAGALMAAWVAMNMPHRCGGLVLLSGCTPSSDRLPEPSLSGDAHRTPVLYMVGSEDAQIPPRRVQQCVQSLRSKGFQVEHHEIPEMGHEIIDSEVEQILKFLQNALPVEPPDPAEVMKGNLSAEILRLGGATLHPPSRHRSARSPAPFSK